MPYKNIEELPKQVREPLPKQAQEIFLKAYNSAWKQYQDPNKRRGKADREEVSFRVAWSAVKDEYEKEGDNWVKK